MKIENKSSPQELGRLKGIEWRIKKAYKYVLNGSNYRDPTAYSYVSDITNYCFTPWSLCDEIIEKVNFYKTLSGKILVVENLEFVIKLDNYKKKYDLNFDLYYVSSDNNKRRLAAKYCIDTSIIICYKKISFGEFDMKQFDNIIGNPPYSKKTTTDESKAGKHVNLWNDFVIKGIDNLKEGGFMTLVHPMGWRDISPSNKLWVPMTSNKIHYLEMHDVKDGLKTFGVTTTYDWYVMEKTPYTGTTEVKDYNGKTTHMDLSEMVWLPSGDIDLIEKLTAKSDEERVEILYNCKYHHAHTDKHMSKTKTDTNIYPCVYYTNKDGYGLNLWYSNENNKGHFGIPKVIVASGDVKGGLVDKQGEYGITEFCFGIVDTPENLDNIAKAISSQKFLNLCETFRTKSSKYNRRVLASFRKDFWKEFI